MKWCTNIKEAKKTYDVVVAGGGTAGAMAAISAARQGAETLVLEEYNCLGGTATAGLVTPWMANKASGVNLNQGLTDELKRRLAAENAQSTGAGSDGWFDPEMLKFVLEGMVLEAGAQVRYYTRVVDAIVEGKALQSMVVHSKSGFEQIKAKVFVDATGDADLAHFAGVPTHGGRSEDGMRQALSLRFTAGNIDLDRLAAFLSDLTGHSTAPDALHAAMVWGVGWPLESLFRQAVSDGVLEERDGDYFQCFSLPGRPGELAFNCPRVSTQLDAVNVDHLTHAQMDGKQSLRRILRFLRTYLPGCEQANLTQLAPMVGIRESRRIEARYMLTREDILQAKKFADGICRNHYPVDIHVPNASSGEQLIHSAEGFPYDSPDAYHEIPYRSLVPVGVEGLLVTGRCIGAEFEAQGSIRIQPNCHTLGEAAGIAAAIAAASGKSPSQLPGEDVRHVMRQKGAFL